MNINDIVVNEEPIFNEFINEFIELTDYYSNLAYFEDYLIICDINHERLYVGDSGLYKNFDRRENEIVFIKYTYYL